MKDILKGLRELKKSSAMAFEMLKVFSEEHENSAVSCYIPKKKKKKNSHYTYIVHASSKRILQDLWKHKELCQEDCSINGEVLTLACFKGKIFSGHSDGTIKVGP